VNDGTGGSLMAIDFFLKLDGITGGSSDAKHKGEIEIESFSFGVANAGTASSPGGGGGAAAGRASFQDFSFTLRADKASPLLFKACASGTHLKQAILTGRRSGEKQADFVKYTLSDVQVSGYQQAAAGTEGALRDQFSLNFSKVEVELRSVKPDGTLEDIKAGWDLKANKLV